MSHYNNLQEEELKIRIAEQFFASYDCGNRIGKIDFCAVQRQKVNTNTREQETVSLLWAEAKRGVIADIYKPLVQLILTIGKARTFETYLPPPFLAAFDAEKIAFIPYKEILPFFSQNDFNWNVTPSDEKSREFGLLYDAVKATLDKTAYLFRYDVHEAELREFIKQHLSESSELIQINKNNFVSIYQRWLTQVQPSISVNWEGLKKQGIIDGDFFLADLLSEKNQTIKDALYVLLQDNRYILGRKMDINGLFTSSEVTFNDRQKAHAQFWSLYQRPPREEYWDYIIKRRDLLVPQDVRERKGSFFTPKIWVDLSQKYLADVLGENWQDEYYVWDCAAGTGNLLNGLTNKYNIWASTLDQQDVNVMKDRIKNGANLLESHVFQFDFLNDEFTKLPQPLQDIINDPKKRKKLVVYINPPYVEPPNIKAAAGSGKAKSQVAYSKMYETYLSKLGKAARETFAQFLLRIYREIPNCKIGCFSKLKILSAQNFLLFRNSFQAKLQTLFLVPSDTFDNVKGKFPIGFFIWDCEVREPFLQIEADVYDNEAIYCGKKTIYTVEKNGIILNWLQNYYAKSPERIAYMVRGASDFQGSKIINITLTPSQAAIDNSITHDIVAQNLIPFCFFLTIRHSVAPTWLNDRDQFLYPNEGWRNDLEFQNDCFTASLFHTQNRVSCKDGTNHWIPFTEEEVDAKEKFESHFMTDFISGRLAPRELRMTNDELRNKRKGTLGDLAEEKSFVPTEPLVFSPEATAVFDAGRELWRYYHAQADANPNASYYDIREHFQGRNEKGRMNPTSKDAEYNRLLSNLKTAMEALRLKIVPKVYEYGFLIS